MGTIVYPGDSVQQILNNHNAESSNTDENIILGRGLLYKDSRDEIKVTQPGALRQQDEKQKWWVECVMQTAYYPAVRDRIIGRIVGKVGEVYRVDIGASRLAHLDFYAFEGATKRNRPQLQVGAVVYAYVKTCCDFMEPEVICMNPTTFKSDGYGELDGGCLIRLPILRAKSFLNPSHSLLKYLGSKTPFELAVGLNGCVWIKSKSGNEDSILIRRSLELFSDHLKVPVDQFVDEIFNLHSRP